jgi:hypothetical protein
MPTGAEADLTISPGTTVTLDQNAECGNLLVRGQLHIAPMDLALTCDSLIVEGMGAQLLAGTDENRFTQNFALTLKGDRSEEYQPANHAHSMGARGLVAMMGGTISLHAADRVEWTRLGSSATAGATSIHIAEPVDWRAGDFIVIASSRSNWNEAEKRQIDHVSADGRTVHLTTSLEFPHSGKIKSYTRAVDGKVWTADLRAEVGLLTRNILIQGATDSVTPGHANAGFGAHVMIHGPMTMNSVTHPAGIARIKGVEITRTGQKSLLGRYPFHWHLCIDQGAGQYFSDSSIHHSFNRAITIHGTDFATVENNFCYDHIGHGVFLEDGAEQHNVLRKNVVLLTKRPLAGEEITPSDNSHNEVQNRSPSSYWITNPNNRFEDNVAAGTQGTGFWFIMPTSPLVPSKNLPYYTGLKPHQQPLGTFSGNSAHSCMNGFDIFDQISQTHAIVINAGWNNATPHVMENCTWYANDTAIYAGIGSGGPQDNVIYRNNVFVDNRTALMLATYNTVEESVFVANSDEGLLSGNRMLYRAYDGAGTVQNCHFVGWNASNANFIQNTGAATKHVNHKFHGITTDHVGTVRADMTNFDIAQPPDAHANHPAHPRFWSIVLRDLDGSLSGKANTSIVSNHPFLRVGDEYQPPNWNRMYRSDHKFALAVEDNPDRPRPNVAVTRTKPGTATASLLYINGYNEHHQLPLIVNEGFLYSYSYTNLPLAKRVTFRLDDATAGDTVTARFTGFGALTGTTVSGHSATSHTSLASLEAASNSGYFIQPGGDIYVRPVATGKSQTITLQWTGGVIGSGLDSDGDGLNDSEEISISRNPSSHVDLGAEFSNNSNFEKWDSFSSINSAIVSGGNLIGSSTGDSKIENHGFKIAAASVDRLAIRMKSSVNDAVDLFWAKDGESFGAARQIQLPYSGGGNWQIIEFPLMEHAEWNGIIKSLRLDPVAVAGTFEIDWIRILDDSLDSDGDGINDLIEGFGDADGDGLPNSKDRDSDGDLMEDGEERLNGRLPYDAGDMAFHFTTDGESQGWHASGNLSGWQVAGGSLSGTTSTSDPNFTNSTVHFKTDQVKQIVLKMRASNAGNVELFFGTLAEPGSSSARRIGRTYELANSWQIVVFNLEAHAKWPGQTSKSLRIDPISVANATWEIDWIRASNGDMDGDGISDIVEGIADIDGDGISNLFDLDSDGDGMSDALETTLGRDPYAGGEGGAQLRWDTDSAATEAQGGSANWSHPRPGWWDAIHGGQAFWPTISNGSDRAVFGGTAGTVTLEGIKRTHSLHFETTGYRLDEGNLEFDGTDPFVELSSNVTATIASDITGANGFSLHGPSSSGTLLLEGSNTHGGRTILASAQRLGFTHGGAFGSSIVQIGTNTQRAQRWLTAASGDAGTLISVPNAFDVRTIRWIIGNQQVAGIASGPLEITGPVTLSMGPDNVRDIYLQRDLTITGLLSGAADHGLNLNGAGTLSLGNSANSFEGGVKWISSSMRLDVASDGALGAASNGLNFAQGGTLHVGSSMASQREILIEGGKIARIEVANGQTLQWNGLITGAGSLVKSGTGDLTLGFAGPATSLSGTVTVSEGALELDGDFRSSSGQLNVSSQASLGGHGRYGGSVLCAGALKPASGGGTLEISGDLTLESGSRYQWVISDWNGMNLLKLGGALNFATSPVTLAITGQAPANFRDVDRTFIIAEAEGGIVNDPAQLVLDTTGFTAGPGTWSVSRLGNTLQLHYAGTDAFANFMEQYPLITGDDRSKSANPDGDAYTNFEEFAYGSDPGNAGIFPGIHPRMLRDSETGHEHFILTLPVRAGAHFGPAPAPTAMADGIQYTVTGSADLSGTAIPVELTPLPPENTLPPLPANYQYRRFRLSDPVGRHPAGFIQSKVEPPPTP